MYLNRPRRVRSCAQISEHSKGNWRNWPDRSNRLNRLVRAKSCRSLTWLPITDNCNKKPATTRSAAAVARAAR